MKRIQHEPLRSGLRFGILGGGQLARMLALKGHELGLEIHVLSASESDPAAQVVRHHHLGDPNKEADLRLFLTKIDIATFESEFLNADLLNRLSRAAGVSVQPEPTLMGRIQDRLTQKELLLKHKLPSAEYLAVSNIAEAEKAHGRFKKGFVLKKRRFGYDGYGTYIVRDDVGLRRALEAVEADKTGGFIAEEFVPFRRELALMVARRHSGETITLPVVESHQEAARCLWVKGPAKGASRLPARLEKFLGAIGYVGIMGVELFETKSQILINELAPRVHNSAHYSLEALEEDQFTLHLKAVLDLPFNEVVLQSKGFAMMNLLGRHAKIGGWKIPEGVHFHWYGKQENRLGRKMGHLTVLGASGSAALKVVLESRKAFDV